MPTTAYGASGQLGFWYVTAAYGASQLSNLPAPVIMLQVGLPGGVIDQNTMRFGQFFIIDGQKCEFSKTGFGVQIKARVQINPLRWYTAGPMCSAIQER